jgi:hypothetical protein
MTLEVLSDILESRRGKLKTTAHEHAERLKKCTRN